ncbi:4Fe-4S binding protein [uncultured Succinivibrio sp.]|uniref:4Fe-4S binding protein n=1 Tax=uncultured Succinivibrio sp. TaxID=540749 RepID=UPI0025D0B070|nr:4Fe-4S binding protein [uncultured Succinivibrio sp.]
MLRDVNAKEFTSLKNIPFAPAYKHTLVSINSGFRTEKPVCDREKCNGCFLCYLYCPDGVIRKEGESVSIDYDYCKGCGICQKICRKNAIHMEKEK